MTDINVRATATPPGGQLAVTNGSTSATVTLPSGLSVGDPLKVLVASSFGTTVGVVTAPTGWTLDIAQTTMGTGSFFVLKRTGGWQTADGTSLVIPLSGVTSGIVWSYASIGLDGSKQSDWDTNGTPTVKGSSSTTSTAVAAGTSSQDILVVFFGKMTSNNGSPTVAPNATLIAQAQPTGASSPNVWVGSYTGVTPATQTITYAAATANGAGVQMPMVSAAPPINTGTVAMAGAGAMGVSAASTAAVAMVGAGTLGVAPSHSIPATVTMAGAGTMSVFAASGPATAQPQSGAITDTGARVLYLTTNVGSARVAYSTHSDLSSPAFTTTLLPDADGVITADITGLTADTTYFYGLEVGGTILPAASTQGRLRTDPAAGSQSSFSLLYGSCQVTDSNHAVFSTIAAATGPFPIRRFLHLGDLHYRDWQTNGISSAVTIKAQQRSSIGQSNFAGLLSAYPWTYTWDNHDWGGADSDASNPAASVLESLYRQTVPHYPLPSDSDDHTGAIDQQFQIGRVAFFMLDTRSQRTNSSATDNSSKTMLGAGQKARLKTWMSTNPAPVKVIVSGIPWKNYGGAAGDRWGSYLTEFGELNTYWSGNGIGHLYAIGGDIHSFGADDGSNESFNHTPNAISSPFDQSGTISGNSAWSQGLYPASGTVTSHLFARLDFTDTGSGIKVDFTGIDSGGTTRMTMSTTFAGNTLGTVGMNGAGSMGVAGTTPRVGAVPMAGAGAMGVVAGGGAVQTGAVAMGGHGAMGVAGTTGALLVAQADPTNLPPRVQLAVFGARGSTVTIMRVDPSGNQTAVRSFDPKTLTGGGAVDYDQDAPFLQTVTYVAVTDTGQTATSDPVTLLVYVPWLFHATIPSLSMPLDEMWQGDPVEATGRGLQYAIGRPGAVPTSDGSRRLPAYDLMVRTDGIDAMNAMRTLLADSSVLLLQGAFEGQTRTIYQWVDVGDVTPAALIGGFPDDPYLQWTLPVAVTDPPVGSIQAQFTYNDLHAQFDSYTELQLEFANYRDLATDTLVGT